MRNVKLITLVLLTAALCSFLRSARTCTPQGCSSPGGIIGAENSIGFHNPTEAQRNLGDAIAFAEKAEGLLRQTLTKAGVDVPMKVDLELDKYLNGRGQKKPGFQKASVFKDPFGLQEKL